MTTFWLLFLLVLMTPYYVDLVDSLDPTVFNLIYQNQHPDPLSCSTRRLLIVHSDGKNFEGTGSITKAIMFGLSEAYHSNRTLIWGKFIPDLYSRTPKLPCYDPNQGGLYNCFFQKLSTCSMDDVTKSEYYALAVNGYDTTKRVSLQEPRKGLSVYIPPKELRNYPDIRLLWPSSFAAYAFRLKFTPSPPPEPPLSCAHVRHGDIKALSYVYRNKGIYEFDDYYHELRKVSPIPSKNIFIASDSIETEEAIEKMKKRWYEDELALICEKQKPARKSEMKGGGAGAGGGGDQANKNKIKEREGDDNDEPITLEPLVKKHSSATSSRKFTGKSSTTESKNSPPVAAPGQKEMNTKEKSKKTMPNDDEDDDDDDDNEDEEEEVVVTAKKQSKGRSSTNANNNKKTNKNYQKEEEENEDGLFEEDEEDDDELFHPDFDNNDNKNKKSPPAVHPPSWQDELEGLLFDEDDEITDDLLEEVAQRIKENEEDEEDEEEEEDEEDDDNEGSGQGTAENISKDSTQKKTTPTCIPEIPIYVPNIFAEKRFRSEFGNHVAATRGGCVENTCSFPHQHIPRIIQDRQHSTVEKDVYNIVKDSIDDIYILSHCMNGFVGQASSHLSTVSILLMIYHHFITPTAIPNTSPVQYEPSKNHYYIKFLDEIGIANGQYESSYFLGTYNAQEYVPPEQGIERYASLEMRFGDETPYPSIPPNLTCNKEMYLFPTIPYHIFDSLIAPWTSSTYSNPICREGTDLQELINYGAELSAWHPNDAFHCWDYAMIILDKIGETLDPLVEEVVRENIVALKNKHFKKYLTGKK